MVTAMSISGLDLQLRKAPSGFEFKQILQGTVKTRYFLLYLARMRGKQVFGNHPPVLIQGQRLRVQRPLAPADLQEFNSAAIGIELTPLDVVKSWCDGWADSDLKRV